METCQSCKSDQPIGNFPWRNKAKGIRQKYCRDCKRSYQRRYYESHRESYLATSRVTQRKRKIANCRRVWNFLLEHPCVDCGETDPIVLQFDHVRGDKKYEISTMLNGGNAWKNIESEIEKCEVRCANCHFRVTAIRGGWYSWLEEPAPIG